jgi:hypothetical protein
MKRFVPLCVLFMLLVGIGGCAKNSADSLMKQQIALSNEMADILESDAPESAMESSMAPLKTRQEELKKKIDALSEEEKQKVMEQNKEAFEKAKERFIEAYFKKVEEKERLEKLKAK